MTTKHRSDNEYLDALTAEINDTFARLQSAYAQRAGCVYWRDDDTPELAYCVRCGENTVNVNDGYDTCSDCLVLYRR